MVLDGTQIFSNHSREPSGLRRRCAQLTIGPCRRVGRVQRAHRRRNGRRRIGHTDPLIHPMHLVRPCGQRRGLRRARPVVEVEVHEIEVPLQLPEDLHNLRIVEAVHLHRDLRNRRQQLVWGCEQRIPFPTLNVHLDDQTPAGVAVPPDLIFQRVEETRLPMAGPVTDAFVVKIERAAVAGWSCGIKTVVLMHRDVIPTRHLASPVVVAANAVRVRCIERLDQIVAHQVSAIIGAAEAFQRTILQRDGLKLCKNRFAQPACRGAVHEIANHDGSRCYESDDDKRDADVRSSLQPRSERASLIYERIQKGNGVC